MNLQVEFAMTEEGLRSRVVGPFRDTETEALADADAINGAIEVLREVARIWDLEYPREALAKLDARAEVTK